ncbi:MAG: hypothetical protein V3V20_04020 [Algisphaera sp.]
MHSFASLLARLFCLLRSTCMLALGVFAAAAFADEPAEGSRPPLTLRPITPLMGYAMCPEADAAQVLQQAHALHVQGLAQSGYRVMRLSCDTVGGRDTSGMLQPNASRFPQGIDALSHALREQGLIPGLSLNASALIHPDATADLDADLTHVLRHWNVDFLQINAPRPHANTQACLTPLAHKMRHIKPHAALVLNTGTFPGRWVIDVADAWRVAPTAPANASDPFAACVLAPLDHAQDAWQTTYPGRTPDLGPLRFAGLDANQRRTHFTLWCMLASPLFITDSLIGDDALDANTRDLITTPELIALHQDPLVQPARRLHVAGEVELWARPLGDGLHTGHLAVAVLNRSTAPATFTLNPVTLGLDPTASVSVVDFISGKPTLPTISVSPHAVVLLRVRGLAVHKSPFAR